MMRFALSALNRYNIAMSFDQQHSKNLREAINLQNIESNPLTKREIEMFAMFEREDWSPERRRAYILEETQVLAAE